MKKIAVICAFPKHNPGMFSVDLAMDSIVENINDDIHITKFNLQDNYSLKSNIYKLDYKLLSDVSQLEEFDKIVIWGDFLLWLLYGQNEILHKKKKTLTNEEILEKWYKLVFLKDRVDLQQKTVIYGTTLYGLNSVQLTDKKYFKLLTELCNNAKLVCFRDVFSSNFISLISDNKNVYYGLDCAFFLNTSKIKKKNIQIPYICYSFGRSGYNEEFLKFAHHIAQRMNLNLINLNWLDKTGLNGLVDKISTIKNSSGVITDIYHCGITSIREKIPVIGIGIGSSSINSSLTDKKKELFFNQSLLNQNYIYAEKIIDLESNKDLVQDAILRLNDNESFNLALAVLEKHKEFSKKTLINGLLN